MKNFILIVCLFMIMTGCASKSAKDNQADPRSVAEAIFDAAKTGKYETLKQLVDVDADEDSKMIARVPNDESIQARFREYFSKGKVASEPVIDGDNASVNILFGEDGTSEETFKMVKKNGKWYLSSF